MIMHIKLIITNQDNNSHNISLLRENKILGRPKKVLFLNQNWIDNCFDILIKIFYLINIHTINPLTNNQFYVKLPLFACYS